MTILGVIFIIPVIIAAVLLAILIFEIAMFISVLRNKNISSEARILWLVGMLLIHPVVAIVYYFTDYRKAG